MPYHDLSEGRDSKAMPSRESRDPQTMKDVFPSTAQREAADGVSCRVGDSSCAGAHAGRIHRSVRYEPSHAARSLLQLQRQFGNRYVGQVLSRVQDADEGAGESDLGAVERSIDRARGGGQGLDNGVRRQMESSFGADFSGVRVHTDSHADSLNRTLNARAFATGQDIFFKHGEYSPGASGGRELLAHELTHVVQQNGGIQRKMTVSQPNDPHEVEADKMASAVMQREQQSGASGGEQAVDRVEDEDKELQTKVDRQAEALSPEEEEKKKQVGG